jgi:hypothetical protein
VRRGENAGNELARGRVDRLQNIRRGSRQRDGAGSGSRCCGRSFGRTFNSTFNRTYNRSFNRDFSAGDGGRRCGFSSNVGCR